MLYTIVLLVCLVGTQPPCQVHEEIAHELAPNPSAAFVQAQALVAQRLDAHPGYLVERWRPQRGREA